MSEKFNFEKKKYLIEGVNQISVALGTAEHFTDEAGISTFPSDMNSNNLVAKMAQTVDLTVKPPEMKKNKFLNEGFGTYVISPINSLNKQSMNFHPCTGLVVAGIDKATGKNISFLTHQSPGAILVTNKTKFISDIEKRLSQMKEMCKEGTIDAVIIGGQSKSDSVPRFNEIFAKAYLEQIELLGREVKNSLGFVPSIVNGPKTSDGPDDFYFDNAKRAGFLRRPKVNNML